MQNNAEFKIFRPRAFRIQLPSHDRCWARRMAGRDEARDQKSSIFRENGNSDRAPIALTSRARLHI